MLICFSSFGIILNYLMTNGVEPFSEYKFRTPHDLARAVCKGTRPKLADCSETIQELIKTCWKPEPTERPDFNHVRKNFFKISLSIS